MRGPLVEVSQVSKSYRLWSKPSSRLGAMLLEQASAIRVLPPSLRRRLAAGADQLGPQFHALREASFTLGRGESLGIIGRNGSGKSTLLQILAGTLQPSAGRVQINGRVAALLELGSGFNPEFSGRENVLLQAALLGFSRREALARLTEVEEFASIGEFIDQPTKVYSTGMLVRLAFASQTILSPELFIVDEALAVGDVFFQAKCARFFEARIGAGMSLILVSHDLLAVKALCQRAIVLHRGHVSFIGPSADAVSHYHQLYSAPQLTRRDEEHLENAQHHHDPSVGLPAGATERNWVSPQEVGSRAVEIVHFRLENQHGNETQDFELNDQLRAEIYLRSSQRVDELIVGLELANRHNQVIYGVTSVHAALPPFSLQANRLCRVSVTVDVRLGAGQYLLDVAVGASDRGDGAPQILLHRIAAVRVLSVRHVGDRPKFFGGADLNASFKAVR